MSSRISPDQLRELLDYSPESGTLTWKHRGAQWFSDVPHAETWNKKYAGKEAFTTVALGYKQGRVLYQLIQAHRVAFALAHGHWPTGDIDHIDGNRSNNRISNLRDVSRSTNCRNSARRKDNKSGVTGVMWNTQYQKWAVYINGKRYIGRFHSFDDAVSARKLAEVAEDYHPNHGRS